MFVALHFSIDDHVCSKALGRRAAACALCCAAQTVTARTERNQAGLLLLCCVFLCASQVELLLTMEEFCGEEGVFELPAQLAAKQQGSGSSGTAFAPLFANLLQLLYDVDLVEEAAINAWAEEKQHADEDEKVFLNKVRWGNLCNRCSWALVLCMPGSRLS
jgi:hypothetical protein